MSAEYEDKRYVAFAQTFNVGWPMHHLTILRKQLKQHFLYQALTPKCLCNGIWQRFNLLCD